MHEATIWLYRPWSCSCLLQHEAGRGAMLSGSPSQSWTLHTDSLRPEDVHSSHYILPADGALAHPLPTFGAGYHVTTLQQHAVDDGVHADSTQVFIGGQLSPDTICWREEQIIFSSLVQASSNAAIAENHFFEVGMVSWNPPPEGDRHATVMLLRESSHMRTFSTWTLTGIVLLYRAESILLLQLGG